MPKIRFDDLPRGLWKHLLERVEERQIPFGKLARLPEWVRPEPIAPEGDCHRRGLRQFELAPRPESIKGILGRLRQWSHPRGSNRY